MLVNYTVDAVWYIQAQPPKFMGVGPHICLIVDYATGNVFLVKTKKCSCNGLVTIALEYDWNAIIKIYFSKG